MSDTKVIECSIINPSLAHLYNVSESIWETEFKKHLEYVNFEVQGMLTRHTINYEWKQRNISTWSRKKDELVSKLIVPLYKSSKHGKLYNISCRPGSLHLLKQCKTKLHITETFQYPSQNPLVYEWTNDFPFKLHPYQNESIQRLPTQRHAHVEITTGGGKAAIILKIVKNSGLRCAVIVPGKENFKSLTSEFTKYFGSDKIGLYGDGKKVLNRPITICIGKSLSLIQKEKNPEAWTFFQSLDMMLVDESHTWGAQSMSKVCYGLLAKIPYRLFLSATQVRSKEVDNLLFSIIGPCVFSLTTAEAVRREYISYHRYEVYKDIPATTTAEQEEALTKALHDTPMAIRRIAFLFNDTIAEIIMRRCLRDIEKCKASLVLVDEVGQIGLLVEKLMRLDASFDVNTIAFAHGETNAERLNKLGLPRNTGKSMEAAVLSMNKGEKLIMIATGCVQTGASFFTPQTCYNFVGGGAKNRVKTLQGAVGRAVRKWTSNPYIAQAQECVERKESAVVVDFDVNQKQLKKHLAKRISYYGMSGTPIDYIVE